MEITKRAAIDKGKQCKLVMLVCAHTRAHLMLYRKNYFGLAYYMFLWLFESYRHCGESGAHMHAIEIEISDKPTYQTPGRRYWPVSVTLNISLTEYRELRENFVWKSRSPGLKKAQAVPMPEFKEIEG